MGVIAYGNIMSISLQVLTIHIIITLFNKTIVDKSMMISSIVAGDFSKSLHIMEISLEIKILIYYINTVKKKSFNLISKPWLFYLEWQWLIEYIIVYFIYLLYVLKYSHILPLILLLKIRRAYEKMNVFDERYDRNFWSHFRFHPPFFVGRLN